MRKMEQQNLVIIMLSAIAILAISGTIALSLFDKKVHDSIINIAFSAVGALGGIIATKPKDEAPKDNTTGHEAIVHAIGESAVRQILSDAQRKMEDE